jgi:hypothetical protein
MPEIEHIDKICVFLQVKNKFDKMIKSRLLLTGILTLALAYFSSGQEEYEQVPLVTKAKYVDTTPPLRDIPVILPGERDRSWKDGIIGNKSVEEEIRNQRADIPEGFVDPVLQTNYPAGRDTRGPVRNFEGVGNVNGVYPPDTDGDVGANHYFQMINLSFAIWDKEGNLLYGPVDNSTLWQGFIGPWTGTNDGDPIVLYDEIADRWMASQFAINTSNGTYWQLVAVSTTPDPLGSYHRYAFQMPAFNDYPKLSVWPDGYYASFNMFGGYTRVGVAAFERDSMLVGAPAQMVYYNQPSGTFSMLPSDFDGTPPPSGTPCFYTHLRTFSSQNLEVYEFDVDWSNPSNSSFSLVNTLSPAAFNPNISNIPQPGTSTTLDALNMMLMYRLQYRNFGSHEAMVTNHTVNAGGRAGIRWYELRKDDTDWYIYQQGTYSPDNNHRWMASVAMAGNGKIAIGFNVSSSSIHPSIYYVGRTENAPLGEMDIAEVMLTSGTGSQSGINRWGDYSCLSVDPVDDTTFWFTTEYMRSSWKTRIASFDFGPIQPPYIDAGIDTTICEIEPFMADAEALYVQSIQWSSSGDGFFPNPNVIDAIYLRGSGDVTAGEVTLYMEASGYIQGVVEIDSLLLSFSKMAIANAGNDTTICAGESVLLSGSAQYQDSIRWATEGDGAFDDIYSFTPVYTPGEEDIARGYAWVNLTAFDSIPCENNDVDKMKITIDQCTNVDEFLNDGMNLSVLPNPTTGRVKVELTGLDRDETATLTLSGSGGQVLFTYRLSQQSKDYSNELDLSFYPGGVYYLKVNTGKEQLIRKIILQ